eukprot:GHRQ01017866.1.p2 GENE.GHRQ01017866.1~~GHRQ01017866.1.p2  ORF type:complete len:125 (-),score=5.18 GHRQ01017866.1:471-845(-)
MLLHDDDDDGRICWFSFEDWLETKEHDTKHENSNNSQVPDPQMLQEQAFNWVRAAANTLSEDIATKNNAGPGSPPRYATSIRRPALSGPTFFHNAREQGITLFEPFGGLGAGLEMILRHGIRVN